MTSAEQSSRVVSGSEDGFDAFERYSVAGEEVCAEGRMKARRFLGDAVEEASGEGWKDRAAAFVSAEEMRQLGRAMDVLVDPDLEAEKLQSLISDWQRDSRANAYAYLPRGRYSYKGSSAEVFTPEKVCRVKESLLMDGFTDLSVIKAQLDKGHVVMNIAGATGSGKSTVFSAQLAKQCGLRVLQVGYDAVVAKEHEVRLSAVQNVTRRWYKSRTAGLCLTTPQEFCGRFFGDGWKEYVGCFDVVVLDESHIPTRYYQGVKSAFSTFMEGSLSFIMLSATNKGSVTLEKTARKPLYVPRRVEDIVDSDDFLDSEYCVDRTMFIVESDERIREVAEQLHTHGVTVYVLEERSTTKQVEEVRQGLTGSVASIRILVAHSRFGTSYNLPVSKPISTGLRRVYTETEKGGRYATVPLTASEIKQHMGRADRGIVEARDVGVVLLPESAVAADTELIAQEEFGTYVLLTAMGIRPGRKLTASVSTVLPNGLSRRVARSLAGHWGVPWEAALKYFDAEGRVPARYADALVGFCVAGEFDPVGEFDTQPHGAGEWVERYLYSPANTEGGPLVKVPKVDSGELEAKFIFIAAIAGGYVVPLPVFTREEEPYSGPEDVEFTAAYVRPTARPGNIDEGHDDEMVTTTGITGYTFDVPLGMQARGGRRSGMLVPGIVASHLSSDGFDVGVPNASPWRDGEGRMHVTLTFGESEAGSPVELNSPGGSTVTSVPSPVWHVLSQGDPLRKKGFAVLFALIVPDAVGFAESTAFGGWNNAWLGVLRSFAVHENVQYVVGNNLQHVAMSLFATLWARYTRGMQHAQNISHVTAGVWSRLVATLSGGLRAIDRDAAAGRLGLVQHDDFIARLQEIQVEFGVVLTAYREQGVYSPTAVRGLQAILPVSVVHGDQVLNVGKRRPAAVGAKRYGEKGYDRVNWDEEYTTSSGFTVRSKKSNVKKGGVAGTGVSARGFSF